MDEAIKWLEDHEHLKKELGMGNNQKDDTRRKLDSIEFQLILSGPPKTDEEKADLRDFKTFFLKPRPETIDHWKWKTDWGGKFAQSFFKPKMAGSSVYRLDYPIENQAVNYFHTEYTGDGFFLEAICNNVHRGESKLDERTLQYARLPGSLIHQWSERPFIFGLRYLGFK